MKIKDAYNKKIIKLNTDEIDIIADDGKTLYSIQLKKDGSLNIGTVGFCKQDGKILDTTLNMMAKASNTIIIFRNTYKKSSVFRKNELMD